MRENTNSRVHLTLFYSDGTNENPHQQYRDDKIEVDRRMNTLVVLEEGDCLDIDASRHLDRVPASQK